MQRGIPNLTVYTFEVPQGQKMPYPDNELWTLDYQEADAFAAKRGYRLVAYDLTMEEAGMIADYTACVICGVLIEKKPDGWVHADFVPEEYTDHEPALSAVLVTRETP